MPAYNRKKNLFIFMAFPEVFTVEDTYLILGSEKNLKQIDLDHIQNVFSIYTFPIWIKHLLTVKGINIFSIDNSGCIKKVCLGKRYKFLNNYYDFLSACTILERKAQLISELYNCVEANELIRYSVQCNQNLSEINLYLEYLQKVFFVNHMVMEMGINSEKAEKIISVLFNLIDNIVSCSYYEDFAQNGINPETGILNDGFASLIKDITELPRVKFKRKLFHLLTSNFFEKEDFADICFHHTTFRFLKLVSNYFFYSNRFKRNKEILYLLTALKRGKIDEILGSL